MQKNIFKTTTIIIALFFSSFMWAQTAGTLTFTFTEIPKTGTYNGNAQHVLAVWIQTNAGAFVKTKLRYVGAGTDDHLPTWGANAACQFPTSITSGTCNTVDGVTGATRSAWSTYTVSWDGNKGAAGSGTLQPDGIYKVSIQSTWQHGTTGTAMTSYTFTKGAAIDHQTPAATTTFSNVTLNWAPTIGTGIENNSLQKPNITVYPNPSSAVFNVDYNHANYIKVINTLGVVVYEEKMLQDTQGTKSIDLTNYANGMYMITVSNEYGALNQKLILNK